MINPNAIISGNKTTITKISPELAPTDIQHNSDYKTHYWNDWGNKTHSTEHSDLFKHV